MTIIGRSLSGSRVLITGGTGSFGHAIVRHLLAMEDQTGPARVAILSRDELKQSEMRKRFPEKFA